MSAESLSFEPVSYRVDPPFFTAAGPVSERSGFRVVLTDVDGRVGRGEVLPLPGWSGTDLIETERTLWQLAASRDPVVEATAGPAEVAAAVDCARWSLEAARSGQPLWMCFGGSTSTVEVSGLADGASPAALEASLAAAFESGYSTVKVKLGSGDDLERLAVVSAAVPPGRRVRLDPNGAWSPAEAVEMAAAAIDMLDSRLEYIEDPVATRDALAGIRDEIAAPIATDELSRDVDAMRDLLDSGLTDMVVLKPALVGGPSVVLGLLADLLRSSAGAVLSSTYDGPDALGVWLHLAAAIAPHRAHGLGTAERFVEPSMRALVPVSGHVDLGSVEPVAR